MTTRVEKIERPTDAAEPPIIHIHWWNKDNPKTAFCVKIPPKKTCDNIRRHYNWPRGGLPPHICTLCVEIASEILGKRPPGF